VGSDRESDVESEEDDVSYRSVDIPEMAPPATIAYRDAICGLFHLVLSFWTM